MRNLTVKSNNKEISKRFFKPVIFHLEDNENGNKKIDGIFVKEILD